MEDRRAEEVQAEIQMEMEIRRHRLGVVVRLGVPDVEVLHNIEQVTRSTHLVNAGEGTRQICSRLALCLKI